VRSNQSIVVAALHADVVYVSGQSACACTHWGEKKTRDRRSQRRPPFEHVWLQPAQTVLRANQRGTRDPVASHWSVGLDASNVVRRAVMPARRLAARCGGVYVWRLSARRDGRCRWYRAIRLVTSASRAVESLTLCCWAVPTDTGDGLEGPAAIPSGVNNA